jgi:ribose transport system ATP-binding protein
MVSSSKKPVSNTEPILSVRQIHKRFGGTIALDGVDLDVYPGEVHAIVGENGAGKSTLMKILSGAIVDYEGQIFLRGRPVRFAHPRDAERAGISIIYQELNLVPELSAAANIFLGRERRGPLGILRERAMALEAQDIFRSLGAEIGPEVKVGQLRVGDQQLAEIAKALSLQADILIMDEPTSALSEAEVQRLFRVIADLRQRGVAILYISHKMDEVFSVADRITVLRDGRRIRTLPRHEATPQEVIALMVGREIASLGLDQAHEVREELLRVEGLTLPLQRGNGRYWLEDVSFSLERGEILGVAGLLGAGRTELLECLFGAAPVPPRGQIYLEGKPVQLRSPRDAIHHGLALVPEDRKRLGLVPQMTVRDNMTLATLGRIAFHGFIHPRYELPLVLRMFSEWNIRAAGPEAPIASLSGGNQQKCILARWLLLKPKVLLLDEPTRGIDVGAKAEIYSHLHRLARQGVGILMTSSELPELLALCDRILVLCEGRKTAEFTRAQATEERIMAAATNLLQTSL